MEAYQSLLMILISKKVSDKDGIVPLLKNIDIKMQQQTESNFAKEKFKH